MPGRNNRQQPRPKLDLLGALQGYYTVEALLQMLRLGVLDRLSRPTTARQLSYALRLEEPLLDAVLQFVAHSTDVIQCVEGRYRLNSCSSPELCFQLEKFAGAYGPAVRNISRLLLARGSPAVDRRALVVAFSAVRDRDDVVVDLVRKSGARRLLDLGCGSAWLLVQLGTTDPQFEAFGIERNKAMCALARKNLRQCGLNSRVRIRLGDARHLEDLLSQHEQSTIEAVHGRSFLNEFFASGDREAVRILRCLRHLFPGRIAWFTDYYSELSRTWRGPRQHRLGLLQDLAQIASLQGVPPAECRDWERIYRKAGCRLVWAQEFQNAEIRWFTHQLQL